MAGDICEWADKELIFLKMIIQLQLTKIVQTSIYRSQFVKTAGVQIYRIF